MVFHWSLSGSKFPQVSRTLLSILTDLNNAVDWMVPICSLISKLSVLLLIAEGLFREHQLLLVSLSPSCSIVS